MDKKLDGAAAALVGRMWEDELQGDVARVEALWGKAVAQGMVDSVRALVERSGETLMVAQNTACETALALALKCGQAEVALLLMQRTPAEALHVRIYVCMCVCVYVYQGEWHDMSCRFIA